MPAWPRRRGARPSYARRRGRAASSTPDPIATHATPVKLSGSDPWDPVLGSWPAAVAPESGVAVAASTTGAGAGVGWVRTADLTTGSMHCWVDARAMGSHERVSPSIPWLVANVLTPKLSLGLFTRPSAPCCETTNASGDV